MSHHPAPEVRAARPRTDLEILDQTEALAREILQARNYTVEAGAQCRTSEIPQVIHAWTAACLAQERLTDTDIQNVLAELGLED